MHTSPSTDSAAAPDLVKVRGLQQRFAAGGLTVAEVIQESRSFQYSVCPDERAQVVRLLAAIDHVDAARELIMLYRECEWRATRLAIVRALGRRPFQRSLEFLMKVVGERADLPLCEAAIQSLGGSHHPLAARFLTTLYRHGPAVFHPAIVGAVAQIPDRALVPELIEALPRALRLGDRLLGRQLILALAELKVPAALPHVLPLLGERSDPALRTCALIAVGKLSRDPDVLAGVEPSADPLEQQLLLGARSQVQIRACWRIEDYLLKIFGEPAFHPMLPLELGTFPEDDLEAGMDLFDAAEHRRARGTALARLEHPRVFGWYAELAEHACGNDAELLLQSLSAHHDERTEPALRALEPTCLADPNAALFGRWVETASVCLPRADAELARLMTSDRYPTLPVAARVVLINHLANFAVAGAPDPGVTKRVAVRLEQALLAESDARVQGRLIRAMAQLGVCGPRVLAWIEANLNRPDLLPSGLQLLERVAPRAGTTLLLTCIRNPTIARRHCAAILRALSAQPGHLHAENPALDELLAWALTPAAGAAERLAALRCLAAHPRAAHQSAIVPFLADEERFQLAAILALKSIASPQSADVLGPLLDSPSESVVGRTVDALSGLPGGRAARLLLAVLCSHLDNHDLCDKILRALQPPPGNREDIVATLDDLIRDHADHPLIDGLYGLRDRMTPNGLQADATLGAEVPRLDAELARRVRGYVHLDEQVKVTLRAAELPFCRPELYKGQLDKSVAILGYCKAIDLYLGSRLGERLLLPRMHQHLYEFQRVVHAAGLGEDAPSPSRVADYFQLGQAFRHTGSPVHKMGLVAHGILSGKILMGDQWKVLDGLRAWAVVLILFGTDLPAGGARGAAGVKALIPLKVDRPQLLTVAERLFQLQDLRNPVAHRQTLLSFPTIDRARTESIQLLNTLGAMLE